MEDIFETLEWAEKFWSKCQKNTPCEIVCNSRKGYAIAFEAEKLQVLLGVLRGPKGGVSGVFYVVDPTQSVRVEQLLCAHNSSPDGQFVDLIRQHINEFNEYCPTFLVKMMEEFKVKPVMIRTLAAQIGCGNVSVRACFVGLPSLGRRR